MCGMSDLISRLLTISEHNTKSITTLKDDALVLHMAMIGVIVQVGLVSGAQAAQCIEQVHSALDRIVFSFAGFTFDTIKALDEVEALLGETAPALCLRAAANQPDARLLRLQCFIELATRVRKTTDPGHVIAPGNRCIALIAVGLHRCLQHHRTAYVRDTAGRRY